MEDLIQENVKLRIKTCQSCIHAKCLDKSVNKCDVEQMVCNVNQDYGIVKMANDVNQTCPRGYWNYISKGGGGR